MSFTLGPVTVEPDARKQVSRHELTRALLEHSRTNWGYIHADLAHENDANLHQGHTVHSRWVTRSGDSFYINTNLSERRTSVRMAIQ